MIVYVLAADADKFISPVNVLTNTNPAGLDVKVPPGNVINGEGLDVAFVQYVVLEYVKNELVDCIIVISCVCVTGHNPPEL